MSTNIAHFTDHMPGHLKRKLHQPEAVPRAETIISDMSDGNLATEFIFSFAGFKYAASHLVLTLIGIMGEGQDSIELSDEDIAKIAECDTRTIQRWRAAYIAQAQKENFWPLEIKQGDYVKGEKYYLPTTYRITFGETVEQIVAHARASHDYSHDRIAAIKKAAELFYDDIEQAPPKLRKRKRSAANTPLAELNRATTKLSSAQNLLTQMPERQRAAYRNGQYEELRTAMETLRAQMAELEKALSGENVSVADKEDTYTNDNVVTPFSGAARPPAYVVPIREEGTTQPAPEPVHSPEAIAAFDSLLARVKHKPQVTRTRVEVVASATTEPPPELPPHELEYVPDAPEPTLTEFDAAGVLDNLTPIGVKPETERQARELATLPEALPPTSKMERDIEERGGTAHYF